jgi:proline iminopeptidase
MNELFPPIQPFNEFFFKVSDLHTLHVEECGNPNGKPVVFLHGGPGGGIDAVYRQYFDPKKWRVVLFSQRGCGKSTPHAELRENTTWDLVSDIEKIREHLKIDRWVVFGGSWGSTLSLAYAETHPKRVKGLILRGIFFGTTAETDWFYTQGSNWFYPDAYEKYIEVIPPAERGNVMEAYYRRLTSTNKSERIEAAKAWSIWEATTSRLLPDFNNIQKFSEPDIAEAFARIECHYFLNDCFFEGPNQLIRDIEKIHHIPGAIVQGRYDVICPPKFAWELHKSWPKSELTFIQDAGHSMMEAGIRSKLIEHTNKFSEL